MKKASSRDGFVGGLSAVNDSTEGRAVGSDAAAKSSAADPLIFAEAGSYVPSLIF